MTFPGRWTRVRIIATGVVLGALFAAVGKRAFNLQVREAERLRAMAEEQYLREVELPPRRGRILDRNGAELASTADVDSIYCNPRRLSDPADAAPRLGRVLGMDRRALLRVGQAQGHARRGGGRQGARAARRGVRARAAAVLSEPLARGDGHGSGRLGRARPRRRRARARQAAVGDDLVRRRHPRRARARPRRRGHARRPHGRGQRRRAHDRSLPDVRHGARHRRRASPHARQGRHRDRHEPGHGRASRDGVGADVQPQRPRRGERRARPRHRRRLRAGLDDEDVHDRVGARRGRRACGRPVRLPHG